MSPAFAQLWSWVLPLASESAEVATDSPTGLFGKHSYLLIAAGALIVLTMILRTRARRGPAAPRQPTSTPPVHAGGREAVERISLDLEETARSVSALLDTKIRVLDKLIHDADERIARMEKLAGSQPASSPDSPAPPSAAPAAAPAEGHAAEVLEHHARIYGLADQGLNVQQISEETGFQRGEIELILSLRNLARPKPPGAG